MLPSSLCRLWQPDRAANAAQDNRSYTTAWGTIPVREQHRWLRQVLRGHYQYYGVIFNYRALRMFKDCVVRLWRKMLGKRSQKGRWTWASYNKLLTAFPLPEPVIQQAWHR